MSIDYRDILNFWYEEIQSKQWWVKDLAFDQIISDRFFECYQSAIRGELYAWRKTAEGRLAEIIVIDQFARNMFRDDARSFAHDAMALVLSQEAIASKADQVFSNQPNRLSFLYMPFMHSESEIIHQQAVKLFSQKGLEFNLDFELKHKVIIDRFGRYPHRNKILGRESTDEELEFLTQKGSSF